MHYLYFVRVAKKEAENSAEARDRAQAILEAEGFATEGGYFGGGRADWFVVGGRWSGQLQIATMKQSFFKELKKLIEPKNEWGYSDEEIKKNEKAFQKVWEDMGGIGNNPYKRSSYDMQGQDDDAREITPELLKAIKKNYGKVDKKSWCDDLVQCFDAVDWDEYPVKKLPEASIGDWLVVIDYHN